MGGIPSVPTSSYFLGLGPKSDFLEQMGLRKVRLCTQKSDFEASQHKLVIVQYCFHTVVQLSVISESVHVPSSKLILAGINTSYMAQSKGAQFYVVLGQYQALV